jgi:mycothiol synthase
MKWLDADALIESPEFRQKYLPEIWANPPEEATKAGHGGGDFFEVYDFLRAIRGEAPCPIGIHEAMDMTLPGLVSQQSILDGGRWMAVPDSRAWTAGRPDGQLQMRLPVEKLDGPPEVRIPEGYVLRQFRESDVAAYAELMTAAFESPWDAAKVERVVVPRVLPGGWFIVERRAGGTIVAAAVANHQPTAGHPQGGEVGQVDFSPEHRGKGLGKAVTAAAAARLMEIGYTDIYLLTDDHRLPALAAYLTLGFEPVLYQEDMATRWEKVRERLLSSA